jgi:hypothetical protein
MTSRVHRLRNAAAAFALLASACLAAVAAQGAVSLDVQASRAQVYLGESFLLNVVVNGADAGVSTPDLSALSADVQLLDSRSQSSRSISFVNGQLTRADSLARLFAFQVKPRTSGVFATGPVRLNVAGQKLEGRGPDVLVVGQEVQEFVDARITASREAVLVDEPFTITLTVAIASLPPPHEGVEPLVPNEPPRLECAYLTQAEIPGLKTPNVLEVLQGLSTGDARAPSFYINNLAARQPVFPFNPFADADPTQPRPIRFRITPQAAVRNGRAYQEYTIVLTYEPKQEGDYTFGPLTFKGPVIVGADRRNQAMVKHVSCVGPAVTVRVVPPPEAGRPESFIGSVGSNAAVHASFDASVCKVGDPLALTLDLTGALSLANMRPPLLNLQPGLANDFRIYDDNVETTALPSGKRFRYRVRPVREGTLEFPPIHVSWFDTSVRQYRTLATEPIPVQARPNTQLIAESGTNQPSPASTRLAIERADALPAAITVVEAGRGTTPLLPARRLLFGLFAAGPLLFLLAWGGRLLHRNRERLSIACRRGRALSQALAALRAAPDAAAAARAIRMFLAARLDVAGAALTPAEAADLLCARGVSAEPAAACGALLARLDQALYRPDAAGSDGVEAVREAQSLLPRIVAELDRPSVRKEDEP